MSCGGGSHVGDEVLRVGCGEVRLVGEGALSKVVEVSDDDKNIEEGEEVRWGRGRIKEGREIKECIGELSRGSEKNRVPSRKVKSVEMM